MTAIFCLCQLGFKSGLNGLCIYMVEWAESADSLSRPM